MSRSPETLLSAVGQGERAAFAELYRATAPKLMGIALRILMRRELAEEALQETYVRAWQKASQFDPALGSAMAWLAAICRNQAIDIRRRQAERIAGLSDALAEDRTDATEPDGILELAGSQGALAACLDQLPANRRQLVMRAYLEGLTREELAALYRMPVNTVKTNLRRSLLELRRCLDGPSG
ncbi:MAG: sigma-70 family RNA polymerase sigma factor [Aestuariivirgaceae bacterium]|jgi:RNA polymerase sigma-70 factor (ECF subfamily)